MKCAEKNVFDIFLPLSSDVSDNAYKTSDRLYKRDYVVGKGVGIDLGVSNNPDYMFVNYFPKEWEPRISELSATHWWNVHILGCFFPTRIHTSHTDHPIALLSESL